MEQNQVKKLHFLFEIFSGFTEYLKKKQMRDFGEIFGLGIGFFNPRGQTVTKEDFIKDI